MVQVSSRVPKLKIEVELILQDGRALAGQVFVLPGQRVIDLLNGPPSFFPLRERESGRIMLCNKAAISTLEPLD